MHVRGERSHWFGARPNPGRAICATSPGFCVATFPPACVPSTVAIPSRQARRDEQGHVLNFHNQGAQERAATQEMQGSVHYGCSMTDFDDTPHLSRRMLLAAAGMTAVSLIGSDAEAASGVRNAAESEPASLVHGLHLQFGADASSEIVVSWHALRPVRHARVALGRLDGTLVRKTDAQEASYTDAKSGKTVYAYHARIAGLRPDVAYMYA